MQPSRLRVINALKRGGTVRKLHRALIVHVTIWVSVGKYEEFKVQRHTIDDMTENGLLVCVDPFADDLEWILAPDTNPEGAVK